MDYLKIEGDPNLVRDKKSQAILNTNVRGWEQFKKAREFRLKTQNIVAEFDSLKSEVKDVKELLQKVLDKLG